MASNSPGQEWADFIYLTTKDGIGYEPKFKNRFVLYLDQVPTIPSSQILQRLTLGKTGQLLGDRTNLLLSLNNFARPSYANEAQSIQNFNDTVYIPGKQSPPNEVSCEFVDFIGTDYTQESYRGSTNSTADILYRWYCLIYNPDYGNVGYKDYFTTEADLYLLAPTGHQIEHWHYYNLWPSSVEFGDVSHNSPEVCTIAVTFKYDRARMISSKSNRGNVIHNYLDKTLSKITDDTAQESVSSLQAQNTIDRTSGTKETLFSIDTPLPANTPLGIPKGYGPKSTSKNRKSGDVKPQYLSKQNVISSKKDTLLLKTFIDNANIGGEASITGNSLSEASNIPPLKESGKNISPKENIDTINISGNVELPEEIISGE